MVERLCGLPDLGSDHGARRKAEAVECAVVGGRLGVDEKMVHEKLRFYGSDGAHDATKTGEYLQKVWPKLDFLLKDTAHASMLVLKRAFEEDEEVAAVDALLVSGKQPPSSSKFLSTSPRFRARMQEEEMEECLQVLCHFGWAPQRFSSRARPLGRVAMRLRCMFTVLAEEAETSDAKRKQWAQRLLQELGGENSPRILLGALLADLTHEHLRWVRTADLDSADPIPAQESQQAFLHRLDVLFTDGAIFLPEAKNTFTGQALAFLRKPECVHFNRQAQVFGLGKRDAVWGPLRRVRAVVAQVKALLQVYRPQDSWQNLCSVFRLPSPLSQDASAAEHAGAKEACAKLCKAGGVHEGQGLLELQRLMPRALAYKRGNNNSQAWARASADFPELGQARALITLVLGMTHSTCHLERLFREIPVQKRADRASLLGVTVQDLLLANQAPEADHLAKKVPQADGSTKLQANSDYLPQVLRMYEARFGRLGKPKGVRKVRRDSGVKKDPNILKQQRLARKAPQPEQEFLRERDTCLKNLENMTEADRQDRVRRRGIPEASPEAPAARPEKRRREAKAPGERKQKRARWGNDVVDEKGQVFLPGQLLCEDASAEERMRVAQRGFKVHLSATEFLQQCFVDYARRPDRRAVVALRAWAPDFCSVAGVAARLAGAYLVEARSLLKGSDRRDFKSLKFTATLTAVPKVLALAPNVEEKNPALRRLLDVAHRIPGSKLAFLTPAGFDKEVRKYQKKERGAKPAVAQDAHADGAQGTG